MSASHDEADRTRRVELPGEETGPVPVSISHVAARQELRALMQAVGLHDRVAEELDKAS